jgi:hypothetical protein
MSLQGKDTREAEKFAGRPSCHRPRRPGPAGRIVIYLTIRLAFTDDQRKLSL